jgi:hypothetical protein
MSVIELLNCVVVVFFFFVSYETGDHGNICRYRTKPPREIKLRKKPVFSSQFCFEATLTREI